MPTPTVRLRLIRDPQGRCRLIWRFNRPNPAVLTATLVQAEIKPPGGRQEASAEQVAGVLDKSGFSPYYDYRCFLSERSEGCLQTDNVKH